MIFNEDRLPADDFHELSCFICYFRKSGKICNYRLLQIIGGVLRAMKRSRREEQMTKFVTDGLKINDFYTVGPTPPNFAQNRSL